MPHSREFHSATVAAPFSPFLSSRGIILSLLSHARGGKARPYYAPLHFYRGSRRGARVREEGRCIVGNFIPAAAATITPRNTYISTPRSDAISTPLAEGSKSDDQVATSHARYATNESATAKR